MALPPLRMASGVRWKDRNTHGFVPGKSGQGKSTLMENFWHQDSQFPLAKVLIEPSGAMSRNCYSLSKRRPTIYSSLEQPVSINPLASRYRKDVKKSIVVEAMNKVITKDTGNALLTSKMINIFGDKMDYALDHERGSLEMVSDLLVNHGRDKETVDGIIARLNYFLDNPGIREMLCGENPVDWPDIIEKGQTFILNCHDMTTEQLTFVGTIMTLGLRSYIRHYKGIYKPCAVYIDEAQNFLTSSFMDTILREGRSRNLSVLLATQHFAGMDMHTVHGLMSLGTYICFRVGNREAMQLSREMGFKPEELQNLPKYHVAYRTGDDKGIIKLPHPIAVKPSEPKPVVQKKRGRGWFTLESWSPA